MPIHFQYDKSESITIVTLRGTLTRLDYRRVMPYLESLVVDCGKLSILLIFDAFEGWMPPELQGEALKRLGEMNDVEAVAICANPQWRAPLSQLCANTTNDHHATFPLSEVGSARRWLVQQRAMSRRSPLTAI